MRDAAQWLAFRRLIVEDDEMEKNIQIKLNGKKKTVRAIEKGGHNFVMLQDLRDERIEISYDGVPVVRVR